MDLVTAAQQYITEMMRLAGPGMKVLMMDADTVCRRRFWRPSIIRKYYLLSSFALVFVVGVSP